MLPLAITLRYTARRIHTRSFFALSSSLLNNVPSPNTYLRKRPRYVSSQPNNSTKSITLISYLTDVEGDAAYLDRYVNQSRVLQFIPTTPRWNNHSNSSSNINFPDNFSSLCYFPYDHCIEFQNTTNNTMLIFGGDMWDKGGSDLYVMRQLLDLKRRYPTRVQLIMGNRDLNKIRICQEMGVNEDTMPFHPGVYWLRNHHQRKGGDPKDPSLIPSQDNASDRLKWILQKTMGSPKAFELRKQELQRERIAAAKQQQNGVITSAMEQPITDEDVVQSYRQSCHPKGELGNYLSNASLAYKLGPLFVVHGALPFTDPIIETAVQQNINPNDFWKDILTFAQPWKQPSEDTTSISSATPGQAIEQWLESLDEFAKRGLQAWKEECRNQTNPQSTGSTTIWANHGDYTPDQPHGQLMQYGMRSTPEGIQTPTVVYNSWSTDGTPQWFDLDTHRTNPQNAMVVQLVQAFFQQANIQLILCGHRPQGDSPWPIRVPNTATTADSMPLGYIVGCDTSYSGDTEWYNTNVTNLGRGTTSPGFRGDVAVTETLVELNSSENNDGTIEKVYWHGVLSDGTAYESQDLYTSSSSDSMVGTVAIENEDELVPSKDETPENTSTSSRWWIKAHWKDGSSLITTAKGFQVINFLKRKA